MHDPGPHLTDVIDIAVNAVTRDVSSRCAQEANAGLEQQAEHTPCRSAAEGTRRADGVGRSTCNVGFHQH